jgi:tRNA A-37 threonylcarbamoyl transferase component Bud32
MSKHSPDNTTREGHRPPDLQQPETLLYGADLGQGAQVGNYIVDELRSRGGFATVYRATHALLGRIAALKVLHKSLVSSETMIKRFRQEAQAVNLIRHPNIVDIYEFGELPDGRPYFVMEWLDGQDLEHELRTRGPMSPAEALELMEDLGAALAAAHKVGVVHRDVKASNVVLVPGGVSYHLKLVDFGIAKLVDRGSAGSELTVTGMRLGTPWNMAPEQILGQGVDARTDIYALGVLLFQILTGQLPFRSSTPLEVEEMHLKAPPPKASDRVAVPSTLDRVIERCLQKKPEQRYATVDALLRDLREAVAPSRSRGQADASKALGVGLYFEVRLSANVEDVEDRVLDDLEAVIASARTLGAEANLHLALDSANALLFVEQLPWERAAAVEVRARIVSLSLALAAALASRANATPEVSFALSLNVGSVVVRNDEQAAMRLVGGDLLAVGDWAVNRPANMVSASREVVADLGARFELEPMAALPRCFQVRSARG